ncbi:hypothetical protein C9374_002877 [Naegleria lovaniensis]|uniref:Uncharacterized protein n=1 Tax=Naegleria lovaniensis TaxID=51637 RepID=A0AA88GE85_NAELO|nr:uncharacterized protein C9374_014293 [Naegleria lovaniensis]XP_044550423.1 uncharacterized protein C9374_002877 [Naegleria lovaniensis]KAG2370717.1 hypothetical protein C9374_014293 [Naegleria lovaniensis]KAG2386431.1 hypothetical protein C9374_002877 [Naegleria lovaniensis]
MPFKTDGLLFESFLTTTMYHMLQQSNNNNSSSSANTSSQQPPPITLGQLDKLSFSIPDLILASLLACTLLLVTIFIILFNTCWQKKALRSSKGHHHSENAMKRNQRIMIGLILLLVLVQALGMTCRCIYTSINMSIVSLARQFVSTHYPTNSTLYMETFLYENSSLIITDANIPYSHLVGMNVANTLELLFTLSNLSVLMSIMCFIGNVFIRTVKLANAQESFLGAGYKTATFIFNVSTVIFSLTVLAVVWTVAIMSSFIRLKLVQDIQIYLYVIGFLIFLFQILLQLAATIAISFKVLQVINSNRSKHIKNNSQMKRAFIKVVILQVTLTLSALLQIIAVAFGAVISEWKYFSLFYLVLNNLGILIFAVVALALYHPIFHFGNTKEQPIPTSDYPYHESIYSTRKRNSSALPNSTVSSTTSTNAATVNSPCLNGAMETTDSNSHSLNAPSSTLQEQQQFETPPFENGTPCRPVIKSEDAHV